MNYNIGHNVLELYNVLVQIRFTTSKTKRDIQYSKLGIRVTLRVAAERVFATGGALVPTQEKKKT